MNHCKNEVVAKSLGEIKDLVKPLKELDSFKSHSSKMFYSIFLLSFIFWFMFYGLELFTSRLFEQQSIDNLAKEVKIEEQLSKRQQILLNNSETKYRELSECITTNEVIK